MKKIYVLVLVCFCLFTTTAQEKIDTTATTTVSVKKLSLNNFWQLLEHKKRVANPRWIEEKDLSKKKEISSSIVVDVAVESGESFLIFDKNGNYKSLISGSYNEGLWLLNQHLILLEQKVPFAGQRSYQIVAHTDDYLTLKKNEHEYKFITSKHASFVTSKKSNDVLIPNQGVSANSIWRGILGMVSLLLIAFLFSSNRKAIKWKGVGIGLVLQLIIAIGVLKVPFIQNVFEGVGKVFINILDYTRGGSGYRILWIHLCISSITNDYFLFSINFCVVLFGYHSEIGKNNGLSADQNFRYFWRRKLISCWKYFLRSNRSSVVN